MTSQITKINSDVMVKTNQYLGKSNLNDTLLLRLVCSSLLYFLIRRIVFFRQNGEHAEVEPEVACP